MNNRLPFVAGLFVIMAIVAIFWLPDAPAAPATPHSGLPDLNRNGIPDIYDRCSGMVAVEGQDSDHDGLVDPCDLDPRGTGVIENAAWVRRHG